MSNPSIHDRDLAPFVRLAFPQAPTERTELTTGQRTFLGALVANGYQPFGEALCLLLLDGVAEVSAVRFPSLPEPDYRNIQPDQLAY